MNSENRLVNTSIIFLALGLLFLALQEFESFLRPLVIALILTFLFAPLTRMSAHRKKIIWATTLAIITILFSFMILLSNFVEEEATTSIKEQASLESKLNELLSKKVELGGEQVPISDVLQIQDITGYLGNFSKTLLSSLGGFFSEFLLVLLFLMFLLPTHNASIEKFSKSMSQREQERFKKALTDIEDNIRAYLGVKSFVSLLTALLSGFVMFIFDVPSIVLFMILIFALNFIPSIGSIFAVLIVLGFYLIVEPISASFFVLAGLLITIQFIIGNVVEPKISGQKLELSPIIILLSLFFWGSVWGIAGMFFAVPFTSIIKIILQNIKSTKGFVKYLN